MNWKDISRIIDFLNHVNESVISTNLLHVVNYVRYMNFNGILNKKYSSNIKYLSDYMGFENLKKMDCNGFAIFYAINQFCY